MVNLGLSAGVMDAFSGERSPQASRLWLRSGAAVAHRIGKAGEARPARRDVAVARPRRLGTHPEGVQLAVRQVEAEVHHLARHLSQVGGAFPAYPLQRLVGANGHTVG